MCLNNVGEVLVEEGVLDLLNNLGRFTNVIDKLTRCLSQRTNIQHTFSKRDVVNNTRCTGDCTVNTLTNNKLTVKIYKFQDFRTNLPTIISRYSCKYRSEFFAITHEYSLTFQESGSFNDCFSSTTKYFSKKNLTTCTLCQECDVVTRFSVSRCQCKSNLITFQRVCLTSNSIICLVFNQTGQTSRAGFRKFTFSRTNIICSERNCSTLCNTMREVKLQIVKVKVNNIVKLRLQGYSRFGRITCTRILNLNLIQSVVSNDCNCFSTETTATFNDNARSRGITSTRICDLDLRQNRGIEQLKVDRECNLWFQCIVMRVTITKFVVLKFFDLTDISTSQEYRCTATLIRNNNL